MACLAHYIKSAPKLDTSIFKQQLEEMIQNPNKFVDGVNEITANEFEDGDELKEWLENIWSQVFGQY